MKTYKILIKILFYSLLVWTLAGCATTGRQPSLSLQSLGQEAIKKDPQNPASWVEYGRLSLYAKDPEEAKKAFRKAIELDEKHVPAYKQLGLILMTEKKHREAEQIYLAALKAQEKDSELWTAYGYCLSDMGNPSKALDAFKKSVEANTSPVSVVSAHLGASGLLQQRGDEAGAKREYNAAVKINPDIEKLVDKKTLPSSGKEQLASQLKEEPFKIDLWLDKKDAAYRIGDEMKVSFKANRPCRVSITVGQNEPGAKTLFPNSHQKKNLVKPGTVYTIPGEGEQYRIRITGPAGKSVIRLVADQGETGQTSSIGSPKTELKKIITILDKKS